MSNFKGSRGAWRSFWSNGAMKIECNNLSVLETWPETWNTINENGKLIIDAANVRQQINFDLPELLKQRNEMLRFLQILDRKGGLGIEIHDKINELINQSEQ